MPRTPAPTSSLPPAASPSAPPEAEEKTEQPDDFASLLAASWFTLTPQNAAALQTTEAGAGEESLSALSAASGGNTAAGASALAGLTLTEQSFQTAAAPADPAAEVMTTAAESAEAPQIAAAAVATATATAEGLTAATRPEKMTAMPAGAKQVEVSATKNDALKSLQTEAAQRDLVSVASSLAAETRQTRSPLTAPSLKSFLGEGHASDSSSSENGTNPGGATAPLAAAATATSASALREAAGAAATEAVRQVVDQVVEPLTSAFEKLARHDSRTLHLRLNPEELGQVDVHLTRDGSGKLTAHLMAEHESARRALHDGLGHLREALEQAGLAVERLDVTVGFNLNAHTGSFSRQQGELHANTFPAPGGRSFQPAAEAAADASRAVSHEDRIVSLRA